MKYKAYLLKREGSGTCGRLRAEALEIPMRAGKIIERVIIVGFDTYIVDQIYYPQ
jgi:hypothetical protein